MVPGMSCLPEQYEQLLKTIDRIGFNQCLKGRNDGDILTHIWLVMIDTPANIHDPAGGAFTQLMVLFKLINDETFVDRA